MRPVGVGLFWGALSLGLHLLVLIVLVQGLGRSAPEVYAIDGSALSMLAETPSGKAREPGPGNSQVREVQLQLLSSRPPSPRFPESKFLATEPALPKIPTRKSESDSGRELSPTNKAFASSSGDSVPPKPLRLSLETWKVDYPLWASQARVGGPVRLLVELGNQGHLEGYKVLQSPHPTFVEAVLRSLRSLPPVPQGSYELLVHFKIPGGP
ncbi:MAG: energy transducer TonB [Bdellovibrio sp.]